MTGKVYLVGAGPGDPELLTLKAARLLKDADVVLHDELVGKEILQLASHAQIRNVGKRCGKKNISQEEINFLMVNLAASGLQVVRLKGGDPFVFARGAEEAKALASAGVPFEIVPGVSSALAAPAAAGIPLTARGSAQSFTVLTGHEDPLTVPEHRWQAIAGLGGTVVILMGAARIGDIAARLIEAGLSTETPVAAIHAATTSDQRVSISSLGEIGQSRHLPPVTFVIGDAVLRRAPRPVRQVSFQSAAGHGTDDEERLGARHHGLGEQRVG